MGKELVNEAGLIRGVPSPPFLGHRLAGIMAGLCQDRRNKGEMCPCPQVLWSLWPNPADSQVQSPSSLPGSREKGGEHRAWPGRGGHGSARVSRRMGQQDFGVTDTPDRGSSKQFPSQGDPRAGGKVRFGRLLWDWFSGGSGRPQEGFEVILVAEQRMSLRKENGCVGGEARRWLSGAWGGGEWEAEWGGTQNRAEHLLAMVPSPSLLEGQ